MVDPLKAYLYSNKEAWYSLTKSHWEKCEGTDKGMLGGNIELNNIDIKESKKLIEDLIEKKFLNKNSLLELGAGIGRVTKNLLKDYFEEIYILEQDKSFCEKAKSELKDFSNIKGIINSSMQNTFNNSEIKDKKFSCIWIQWCIENIDDNDLVYLLSHCKLHLEDKGVVIIKENVVEDTDKVDINDIDYSRVRNDILFKNLFKKSSLKIFKHMRHPNWPKEFMDVSIYVLM